MEGEQFSLCWNNFHNNLSTGFHALYKEEDLVDVTLAAEGKYIKAHKTVLSVCSPYFKELFRINPCKHPIVILQDVNYTALCSLLQFMYQGQVSVSQEEIPTFMKVAETLKVKGLTDNGTPSIDANGMNSHSEQKNTMKKPMRPVKKVVRPVQQSQRPTSSPIPRTVKSPLPSSSTPPAKKMHLDESLVQKSIIPSQKPTSSIQQPQQIIQHSQPQNSQHHMDYKQSLLQPKMEPLDHPEDDDSTQHSFDEEPFDMNTFMAQTLDTGEHSMETMPPGWMSENMKQPDTSTPGEGRLFFLRSGKGHLVLIYNGHMYTLGKAKDNKYLWICVKKRNNNCNGCVVTMEGPVLINHTVHNHSQLNDVIKRLQVPPETPLTALNLCKKDS